MLQLDLSCCEEGSPQAVCPPFIPGHSQTAKWLQGMPWGYVVSYQDARPKNCMMQQKSRVCRERGT